MTTTRDLILRKIRKNPMDSPRNELTKPTQPSFVSFVGDSSHQSVGKNGSDPIQTENLPEPDPALPESVDWESPLFGKLSGGPVLEMTETTFTLVHPLTGEIVTLSKEWLVTMEEHDGGLPREEADRKARGMLFNQVRKKREG